MEKALDQELARALEQLRDDESLTADLPDPSAEAVLGWIEHELRTADDPRPVARRVETLRQAVKIAARESSDDPHALLARARAIALAAAVAQNTRLEQAGTTAVGQAASRLPRRPRFQRSRASDRSRARRRRGWSG